MKELIEQYILEKHELLRQQDILLRAMTMLVDSLEYREADSFADGYPLDYLEDYEPATVTIKEGRIHVSA